MNKDAFFKELKQTGKIGVEQNVFFILEHCIDKQALARYEEELRERGMDNEWYIEEVLKCAIEDCKQYAQQRKPMPWDEEMEKGKGRNERGAGRKKKDLNLRVTV